MIGPLSFTMPWQCDTHPLTSRSQCLLNSYVPYYLVAAGAGAGAFLMIPPALRSNSAGSQCRFGFPVHRIDDFTNQATPRLPRIPVSTARFGAVAGEAKPLFGRSALPGLVDKRLVDNNRLIEVFDLTIGVLNTEQGRTGFGD